MSFGSFSEGGSGMPMAEINTTPLVDVMLVLLVIFIITAPLFNQAVPIDLPKVQASKLEEKPLVLQLAVDAAGDLRLNNEPVHSDTLEALVRDAAKGHRDAELHLRADRATRYERIAEVMARTQRAGVQKIAFVTEPAPTAP